MDMMEFLEVGGINGEEADEGEDAPPKLGPMVFWNIQLASNPIKKDVSYTGT